MDALFAVAFAAASVAAAVMLADTLTLSFGIQRARCSVPLLILAALVVAFAGLAGTTVPMVYLLRGFATVFVGIAMFHGFEVSEHDHLWVPTMCVPAYVVFDALHALL